MSTAGIARRKYLVDALHEALPELERALLLEGKGRHSGVYLQRALVRHADDGTLARIVEDIKQEIAALSNSGGLRTAAGLAVETRGREPSAGIAAKG